MVGCGSVANRKHIRAQRDALWDGSVTWSDLIQLQFTGVIYHTTVYCI